jgi:hypothetical protein
VMQYPTKILTDIKAGNWEQLVNDVAAAMVDAAHEAGVFTHKAPAGPAAPLASA